MLTLPAPLHAIAARRGDGLRPELTDLLEHNPSALDTASGETEMSREQDNKALVSRWFEGFWGNPWNPQIIDQLAAPDMLLQYSLHAPRRGREDVRNFMLDFRAAFPDLKFWGAADLIAEGDYVVGRWEGGGTIQARHSAIFSLARCRRHPVGRCTSRERPYFESRTARSRRKSGSTTASPR
jgi:hypothetical protein